MGFLSRLPDSNDPPKEFSRNPWSGATELLDEVALLLNFLAKRCSACKRVTHKQWLIEHKGQELCPDCAIKQGALTQDELRRKIDNYERSRYSGNVGCASGEDGEAD